MKTVKMTGWCIYCHRPFPYTPTTGDSGMVCRSCRQLRIGKGRKLPYEDRWKPNGKR